jgi:hypothetical protein
VSSPNTTIGPQVSQVVFYQVPGTHAVVAAIIYGVNADGTVNLVYFNALGATSASNVSYSPGVDGLSVNDNRWSYPAIQ